MALSSDSGKGKQGAALDRSARAQMEEAMGRLDLTEEEATPLVVDDLEEGTQQKWAIAGKILHRNQYHIQTIGNVLRPAWGNPRVLQFRSMGMNMFVAEFEP